MKRKIMAIRIPIKNTTATRALGDLLRTRMLEFITPYWNKKKIKDKTYWKMVSAIVSFTAYYDSTL